MRLGEGHYLRLRRQSLRSGIPMSVLVRALVERWLDEQEQGEAPAEPPRPKSASLASSPTREVRDERFGQDGHAERLSSERANPTARAGSERPTSPACSLARPGPSLGTLNLDRRSPNPRAEVTPTPPAAPPEASSRRHGRNRLFRSRPWRWHRGGGRAPSPDGAYAPHSDRAGTLDLRSTPREGFVCLRPRWRVNFGACDATGHRTGRRR